MGKIYDALEKAQRERLLINKGIGKPVQHDEPSEYSFFETSGLTLQQIYQPKEKKRNNHKKKRRGSENLNFLITEQFRALKTKILNTNNGNPPRTILVTSALPREGKSIVAANLAISLAQGVHKHALIVDSDFRKPDIHKLFALAPEKGLADYLSGNIELTDILLKTDIPKLTLIPVGKKPSNPLDILASEKMKYLIQELKSRYNDRYIIFDSSPIQLTSEPTVLLSQVDGIVLVVKAGKSTREMVTRIIQDLEIKKFLGIVLNGVKKSFSTRHFFNCYRYYH